MLLAAGLVVVLLAACVFVHYEALRLISSLIEEMRGPPRRLLLVVVFGAMAAHMMEISIWAVGYWVSESVVGLGSIFGTHPREFGDVFYFSVETYTSLGLGDLAPVGPMRLLAGMETLTGLILIGWSASFTYLAMTRFWGLHKR